jgi:hypothetical protein
MSQRAGLVDDRQFFWLIAADADTIAKSCAVDTATISRLSWAARTSLSLAPAFEALLLRA